MSKNKKVMSIAIRPELHDELKKFAKRKNMSASSYVGDLVEQAVKLDPDDDPVVIGTPVDEEVKAVVLKIPVHLKSDPEQLKKWLSVQVTNLYKKLTEQPPVTN